ncbi:uncharacterized protein LOC119180919 [Rhipicephalus microplus]|uniref:uncharacterized protein LOC119180919 n=1 Tax=Rhipicephalus microplus TaxID=6941 RepID=UPI003F6C8655
MMVFHTKWHLLNQITCLTTLAFCMLAPGVRGAATTAMVSDVDSGNSVMDDTVYYSHRQGGGSLTTSSTASPMETLLRPRASSKDALAGSGRDNQKRNESERVLPHPRSMCFYHISKKFVAVRSFHVQASALGRAVLATVFLATSLLAVASLFAMVWCVCRGCRSAKKEGNPVAVQTPPPAYTASKGGSFGGFHDVLNDTPPPYGCAMDSTTMVGHTVGRDTAYCSQREEPHTPTLGVPSQQEDRPPTYDAVVSCIRQPPTLVAMPG